MNISAPASLPWPRRIIAAGLAALVLALAIFAVAPELHETLHADADRAEHECAIVLYAGGITLTVAVAAAPAFEVVWRETPFVSPETPGLISARNLLPHTCGPPATRA